MNTNKSIVNGRHDRGNNEISDIALAAIVSYKKRTEVRDFMDFILGALERNAGWLDNIIDKQKDFRCVFMTGAGPHRFQVQEVIYPKRQNIKLKVEPKDSVDYDKVAMAAVLKMPSTDVDAMMKFIKNRISENPQLTRDLLKGKRYGVTFAFLRPLSEKQYRISEKIIIKDSINGDVTLRKIRREDYNANKIQYSPLFTRRKMQRMHMQRLYDLDSYLGTHGAYDYILYM